MKSLLNNNTVVIKSAVDFFFLFFLHGFSIGNGQKGISYNVWYLRMFIRKDRITTKEMTREELINLIESRIKSEYKKHGNLDWAGIAARKIYGSLEGVLDVGKEREDLVGVTNSLLADFLKYAIDDTMRISGDHNGLAGTIFVGDTYEKIAGDYISICNDR